MWHELMADAIPRKRNARRHTMDRVSGGLVNAILGALILWVGQTTFRHAGQLASVNQQFDGVGHQIEAVDKRHESLRLQVEGIVGHVSEKTRSRFTREDGDKIENEVKEIGTSLTIFERQMLERLTSVQLKIIALETRDTSSQEVAMLRSEVDRLRAYLASRQEVDTRYAQPLNSSASAIPVHLPPTTYK